MDKTTTQTSSQRLQEYEAYIKSPEWKQRRKLYLKTKRNRSCFCCGSKRDIHIHHTTYKRFGHEDDSDLEIICRECHQKLHELVKQRKTKLLTAHFFLRERLGTYKERKEQSHSAHKSKKQRRRKHKKKNKNPSPDNPHKSNVFSEKVLLNQHGVFGVQDLIKREIIAEIAPTAKGKRMYKYLKTPH